MTESAQNRRVALITGASSGIGAATAVALARDGWQVAVCGRNQAALEAVAVDARGMTLQGDLLDTSYCERAAASARRRFGRLDGLVLNAGLATVGTAEQTTIEQWQQTLQVNLTGPFLMARAALPALRESRGSVVAVSSIGGLRAAPRSVAYAASKGGLILLAQALALDHGPEGIRVNSVCPGWTRTGMSDAEMTQLGAQLGISVEEAYSRATALVPQRRPARPAEIAAAIAWLLSPAASYVNGATLTVDGGTTIVDAGMSAYAALPDAE